MSHGSIFDNPFLLGFDQLQQMMERISKNANDAYPPYNIQHSGDGNIRITIAVAGFSPEDLDITLTGGQLSIRGKQAEKEQPEYLHRGIAARQFLRKFVLAAGMEVSDAFIDKGLLNIDLLRTEPVATAIPIRAAGGK